MRLRLSINDGTGIQQQQVQHVAALAGLTLSRPELSQYTSQLSRILVYVGQLQELDIGDVEPQSHGPRLAAPLRPDRQRNDPDAAAALMAQAPRTRDGYLEAAAGLEAREPRPGMDDPAAAPEGPKPGAPTGVIPPCHSLVSRSATELANLVRRREVSAEEVTRRHLERAHSLAWLGAYLTVDHQGSLEAARRVDAMLSGGRDPGPLAGVPLALKDSLVTRDLETTCGSRTLKGWIPPYDATVVSRLRQAGAVILGKTNMDEFSMGSSCERSAFYSCRNPLDPARVPGGSSGGSAAAVAAHICAAALGSDTGGSIRQPAAFCGVVGFKPTYGRVSRRGLIAFASSLDQVGPLARTVEDCALLMEVIAGHDPRDSTSIPGPVESYVKDCGGLISGVRVGVPTDALFEEAEADTAAAVERALGVLERLGAVLVPVTLPHGHHAVAAYHLIATSEASSNLARFDGLGFGEARSLGPEVKRRIMLGTFALSAGYREAYYARAQQVRALISRDFDAAFASCDVIATPTTPGPAFALGERVDDPLRMYLSDLFTTSCNLAGLPGLSVPCGLVGPGLPAGLQLLGPAGNDQQVLSVAAAYRRGAEASP